MNNLELAKEILKNVGGESNIHSLVHCVTRLRFKLVDNNKANKDNIKNLEGVLSVVESGGQFQVVIGNKVGEIYKEIMKLTNITDRNVSDESKDIDKEVKEKINFKSKVLDLISSVLAPVLSILASVSILKGILAILVYFNYISVYSGTYQILHAIENSALYFMPILMGLTAAKKFKANEFIAVTLGAILISPGIIEFINKNNGIDFLFINIKEINYGFTFIPIIISVWLLSKLEEFLNKVMNENLKPFFMPLICLIVMTPLTFIIIGPIATIVTGIIGSSYNFIYNLSPIILGAIVGAFWQVLVIKGVHWLAMPIIINNLSLYGFDTIFAFAICGSIGQAGSVLGVLLKSRDKNIKKAALSTIPTGLLGITEPTIYKVTLKYKTPFICASIAGAVGGAIVGYSGSATMGYIIPGLLTLPAYFGKGFGGLLIAIITSYLLAGILSFILFKDSSENKDKTIDTNLKEDKDIKNKKDVRLEEFKDIEILTSPMKGEIKDLSEAVDKVFAEKSLGDGVAIVPSEGKLVSPVDGIVSVVFPTGHAVAVTSNNGVEILMHIGFNTVSLDGKYFKVMVAQDETVKRGDILVEFNIDKIKEEGLDITTPMVVTNSSEYSNIRALNEGFVKYNDDILTVENSVLPSDYD
ncbi:beta-glucoside-specific PTS transporter subunit IIABC [Clostridium sp.]|uniref:beta-glucoside-specific PTS transporter subunit IIABC n=1 Tax=Clostridium sp. TaxID=1506 RepID=UPI001D94A5F8|nr:beta-glucoside-specific PTS transporter subunit IIABC [Clostridium sp.]MBS5938221.1 beta-glucoside-specific PTS transporter subunit IIABC [Clostridium sp.]